MDGWLCCDMVENEELRRRCDDYDGRRPIVKALA